MRYNELIKFMDVQTMGVQHACRCQNCGKIYGSSSNLLAGDAALYVPTVQHTRGKNYAKVSKGSQGNIQDEPQLNPYQA